PPPRAAAPPPLLNTTSWQSGDTPCGKSAGAMSLTNPPKISIGASNDPIVAIVFYSPPHVGPAFRGGPFLILRSGHFQVAPFGVRRLCLRFYSFSPTDQLSTIRSHQRLSSCLPAAGGSASDKDARRTSTLTQQHTNLETGV